MKPIHIEVLFGKRKAKEVFVFNQEERTFGNYYKAESWCKENGYSYGSMDGHNPIAIWKGDCSISKWHNLSKKEQNACDGVMTGDFREGWVRVLIFNK